MDSLIHTTRSGRVLTIEITRPGQLNALNSTVLGEILGLVNESQHDDSLGAIIIRGRGDRAFSAGADLDEIRGLDIGAAHSFIRKGQRTMTAIADSIVPVVADVDGFALGGGFELMLSCHVVIASDRSRFGLPEARIGCIPGFGGTQRLAMSVSKPAALLMMLGGERVDADRAWEIGLLSVPPLPPEDSTAEARRLAELIASGSRSGVANILDAARAAFRAAALDHEAALAAISIAAPDGQEGITSFAERRAPIFHQEIT